MPIPEAQPRIETQQELSRLCKLATRSNDMLMSGWMSTRRLVSLVLVTEGGEGQEEGSGIFFFLMAYAEDLLTRLCCHAATSRFHRGLWGWQASRTQCGFQMSDDAYVICTHNSQE